jgi:predicted ATPase
MKPASPDAARALDWSHGLLSAEEQTVFRRLGVFAGGFSLELAQQVASDERIEQWLVLDLLGRLIDKSLVIADSEVEPRYRLLETTRAFALEQLAAAGESEMLQRHAQDLRVDGRRREIWRPANLPQAKRCSSSATCARRSIGR